MRIFDKSNLLEAWASNQRLDGGADVLVEKDRRCVRPFWPPFVQAEYQLARHEDHGLEQRDRLLRFETLSIAARAVVTKTPLAGIPTIRTDARFPLIETTVLAEAIADIVRVTTLIEQRRGQPSRQSIDLGKGVKVRVGAGPGNLQIVGCRIGARSGPAQPLRLDSAKLPFSLRLIGCVIESPLILPNCDLVSLDLSGSAILGLDASFLRASGSVRLRRSVLFAPADFSGARVHGFFDASDCVALCREQTPESQAFAADRGVLNLSQATIENELYLSRARIWGGLTLKGAKIDRSIFMDDAITHSPVGFLERQVCDKLASADELTPPSHAPEMVRLRGQERQLAKTRLHKNKPEMVPAEIFEGMHHRKPEKTALYQLLSESVRARGSAIRADGIRVGGSFFARGIQSSGRVRLKYADITGGLHLQGAWLRSGEAMRGLLEAVGDHTRTASRSGLSAELRMAVRKVSNLLELWADTKWAANDAERAENDDFALDLREASIGGGLSLGIRKGPDGAKDETTVGAATLLQGTLAASSVRIDGELNFEGLRADRPVAAQARSGSEAKDVRARGAAVNLVNAVIGDDVVFKNARDIDGVDLDKAEISGSLSFGEKYAPNAESHKPSPVVETKRTWIGRLRGRVCDRDESGLSLENADVEKVLCLGRATGLTGAISLRGTRIRGDAVLVYHPDQGPSIKAELARIDGRLDIYPAPERNDAEGGRWIKFLPRSFVGESGPAAKVRAEHRRLKKFALKHDVEWLARAEPKPYIDLRNARATIFCHPEPAWPEPEGLSLAGFRFERTLDIGPLATYPFPRRSPHTWARERGLIVISSLLALSAMILLAGDGGGSREAIGPATRLGVTTLWCLMAASLTGVGIQLSRLLSATSGESRPTAITWLSLQRVSRNRYRRPGAIYWPLDPYIQAAKAMREEGRYIGANLVEKERLKQRRAALSWRHHTFLKAGMYAIDWVAGFGFNTPRALVWLLVAVFITAFSAQISWVGRACGDGRSQPCAAVRSSGFEPMLYSSHIYFPLLGVRGPQAEDLGRRSAAVSSDKLDSKDNVAASVDPFPRIPMLEVISRIFGLALTGIIAAALGARAQSAFAQVRE